MSPKEFWGTALMAIGGVTALLSGGCTLVVIALGGPMVVDDLINGRETLKEVLIESAMPLTFGVLPFCVAFWLYKFGQRMRDPSRAKKKIEIE
jgi:hypothetical protein